MLFVSPPNTRCALPLPCVPSSTRAMCVCAARTCMARSALLPSPVSPCPASYAHSGLPAAAAAAACCRTWTSSASIWGEGREGEGRGGRGCEGV